MQPSAPPRPRGIEAQVVAAYPSAPYKEATRPTGQSPAPEVALGSSCLSHLMSGTS